jgi:hypothetical protein
MPILECFCEATVDGPHSITVRCQPSKVYGVGCSYAERGDRGGCKHILSGEEYNVYECTSIDARAAAIKNLTTAHYAVIRQLEKFASGGMGTKPKGDGNEGN